MLNIAVLDDEDIYIDRICKITEKCMDRMSIKDCGMLLTKRILRK